MEEEQKEIVDIVDGEDDDKGKEEMSGDEQGPQKTREELLDIARENVKIGDSFLASGEQEQAVEALGYALNCFKDAFKDQDEPVELAPVYLKYGMTLMRVAERNMEQAMNELMIKAMREQAGGGASGAEVKKLSQEVIEEQAAEHLEDLDEAWDALEMARLRYEGANDHTSACIARMALGDLCVITEDWEGADREFSACAEFRLKEYGDDRRTADAVFMSGLAKQMIPEKQQESLAQYVLARDIIARLVAKATASNDPDLAELQSLLPDLEEKVANFGKDGDGEEDDDGDDDDAGMVEADEEGNSGKRALEEEVQQQEQQQQQQAPSQDQAAEQTKKAKLD